MSTGIDYGRGKTNIDTATGIRYGVISMHSVGQALYEAQEFEYDYEVGEGDSDDLAFAEPTGWHVDQDGHKITDCLDNDAMVMKSPYYTFAPFCSPCVPGAGDLNNARESGVKTYCLGHNWFDSGKAPYPVYSVETDEEVT